MYVYVLRFSKILKIVLIWGVNCRLYNSWTYQYYLGFLKDSNTTLVLLNQNYCEY